MRKCISQKEKIHRKFTKKVNDFVEKVNKMWYNEIEYIIPGKNAQKRIRKSKFFL